MEGYLPRNGAGLSLYPNATWILTSTGLLYRNLAKVTIVGVYIYIYIYRS